LWCEDDATDVPVAVYRNASLVDLPPMCRSGPLQQRLDGGAGVPMMRVFAYLVGVSVAISIVLLGVMALRSPNIVGTPFAATVLLRIRMPIGLRLLSVIAATHKERLAERGKQQTIVGQKKARTEESVLHIGSLAPMHRPFR
jgi:hypothetical protein